LRRETKEDETEQALMFCWIHLFFGDGFEDEDFFFCGCYVLTNFLNVQEKTHQRIVYEAQMSIANFFLRSSRSDQRNSLNDLYFCMCVCVQNFISS
jgi:hypothetical protein